MRRNIVENLRKGVSITDYMVFAKNIMRGRFREEVDLDVYLKKDGNETHLLYLKLFQGRRPHYKPWIELFGIERKILIGNNTIDYFGSHIENSLLQYVAQFVDPGENLFVDYYRDHDTRKQLELGVPAAVSRLGCKLYTLGFTWFKDWYFPEGFMEGEQKLQAERPLNKGEESRQKKVIYESIKLFLENIEPADRTNPHLTDVLDKSHKIIEQKMLAC